MECSGRRLTLISPKWNHPMHMHICSAVYSIYTTTFVLILLQSTHVHIYRCRIHTHTQTFVRFVYVCSVFIHENPGKTKTNNREREGGRTVVVRQQRGWRQRVSLYTQCWTVGRRKRLPVPANWMDLSVYIYIYCLHVYALTKWIDATKRNPVKKKRKYQNPPLYKSVEAKGDYTFWIDW